MLRAHLRLSEESCTDLWVERSIPEALFTECLLGSGAGVFWRHGDNHDEALHATVGPRTRQRWCYSVLGAGEGGTGHLGSGRRGQSAQQIRALGLSLTECVQWGNISGGVGAICSRVGVRATMGI